MEEQVASRYLYEVEAYKCLNKIKRLLPKTNTGKINYISDIFVARGENDYVANSLAKLAEDEQNNIENIITILFYQKNFTVFPETTLELQKVAQVLFEDCIRRGYTDSATEILACIAEGALDIHDYAFPNKNEYLHSGVIRTLESYAINKILTNASNLKNRAILFANRAYQGQLGVKFTVQELIDAYNLTKIGSRVITDKISSHDITQNEQ